MNDVIFTKDFKEIELKDIPLVGGKNASLGEMIKHLSSLQVNVPQGFALTTEAYWQFMNDNNLSKKIMSFWHAPWPMQWVGAISSALPFITPSTLPSGQAVTHEAQPRHLLGSITG